jgi:hypothetical protein
LCTSAKYNMTMSTKRQTTNNNKINSIERNIKKEKTLKTYPYPLPAKFTNNVCCISSYIQSRIKKNYNIISYRSGCYVKYKRKRRKNPSFMLKKNAFVNLSARMSINEQTNKKKSNRAPPRPRSCCDDFFFIFF